MSTRPSAFIWYELMTSDIGAAAAFYGQVVGWSAAPSGQPGMDYRLLSIGGEMIAGLLAIPAAAAAGGMKPAWLGYVSVADVDASLARILAAGGTALVPATDIPGIGRFAMIADPQGAPLSIMTPAGEGPSPSFGPGKPGHGGWHELHTTDWEAALAFYGAQLGWAKSDAMDMGPMGTYLLFNAGGEAIGGMMNNPAVPRPGWLYYFMVEEIGAAMARVTAAGGRVLHGPQEVPGGAWIIQGMDPQGAMFALVGPQAAGAAS